MFKEESLVKWLKYYNAQIIIRSYDTYKERFMYLIKLEESGKLYTACEEDLELLE